jgi:hypothetical protein
MVRAPATLLLVRRMPVLALALAMMAISRRNRRTNRIDRAHRTIARPFSTNDNDRRYNPIDIHPNYKHTTVGQLKNYKKKKKTVGKFKTNLLEIAANQRMTLFALVLTFSL